MTKTTPKSKMPSIHENVPPLEIGGYVARDGFNYQDHVALSFCIDLLTTDNLAEVRCESQDDITLIWNNNGAQTVEFVQVKGNILDQLWSIPKLCTRENDSSSKVKKSGSSIIEKLFANDRFEEDSIFRIVTRRAMKKSLEALKYEFNHPQRIENELEDICKGFIKKIGQHISPKGNDLSYFVNNLKWTVEESIESLRAKTRWDIKVYIEDALSTYPLTLNIEKVYDDLLLNVKNAASADWKDDPKIKCYDKQSVNNLIVESIDNQRTSHPQGVKEKLLEKMRDGNLPSDYEHSALEMIRSYRMESLSSRYFTPQDRKRIDFEMEALLFELRNELDAGKHDDGVTFHNLCMEELRALKNDLDVQTPYSYLYGYMYYRTSRCGHRFRGLGK